VPRAWIDPLVQTKQCKSYMRFGTWNVRNLYRSGSFLIAAMEFAKYILDLLGVHEVRWHKRGTVRAGII
jgi:hypothetical protein